jgi:hypothetical protein
MVLHMHPATVLQGNLRPTLLICCHAALIAANMAENNLHCWRGTEFVDVLGALLVWAAFSRDVSASLPCTHLTRP